MKKTKEMKEKYLPDALARRGRALPAPGCLRSQQPRVVSERKAEKDKLSAQEAKCRGRSERQRKREAFAHNSQGFRPNGSSLIEASAQRMTANC